MQIIPIKKSSIKKNPDAGKTEYSFFGGSTITGTWKGKMPKWLENKVHVLSASYPITSDTEYEFQMDRIDEALIKKITQSGNGTINIEHHYNHTTSMWPEPEYTFEYHNPLIECSECSKQVRFKDIKSGCIINEEGEEFNADECPSCGSLDSFKYRLQRIDEVQK